MELASLTRSWRNRMAQQREVRQRRAVAARSAAGQAAHVLQLEFGADEVWLFGSLATEPQHDHFDIDLAVRGVAPERYFAALARVCDVVGGSVDLVTLETCSQRLRQRVVESGERLDG